MTRKVRTHVTVDDQAPGGQMTPRLTPKHLTKQEFAKRVYDLMMRKGWHQSELARRSGLNRDSISTYVNGTSLPTPVKLQALAKALEVEPNDLLPNYTESAIEADNPSFEMKVSTSAPSTAW